VSFCCGFWGRWVVIWGIGEEVESFGVRVGFVVILCHFDNVNRFGSHEGAAVAVFTVTPVQAKVDR
jgi:hypothetical protein